jgi:hypothetical protein
MAFIGHELTQPCESRTPITIFGPEYLPAA